jgi:RHS repeat-associated protein
MDGKTLTYDALDRVVEEGTTVQILYGPTGKLGIQNGQTNVRTYLGLPKAAGIIYDGTSVVYQHPDLMGNGILGTNNTQGKVFDRFFAPFGEEYGNSGSTVANFTGHTQDLDPNLYDFTYREESPVQGRWLNPDPSGLSAVSFGDPQTLNRYSYVRNSAMGMVDPNGLRSNVWAYVMSFNVHGGGATYDFIVPDCFTCSYAAETYVSSVEGAGGKSSPQQSTQQNGCGFWCGFGQRFSNAFGGYGFHTDAQVEDILRTDSLWLRSRGVNTEGMTEKQIIHIHDAIQIAMRSGRGSVDVDGKLFIIGMIGSAGELRLPAKLFGRAVPLVLTLKIPPVVRGQGRSSIKSEGTPTHTSTILKMASSMAFLRLRIETS